MAMMKKPAIEEMFRILQQANPKPESDLKYTNTYTLLVAVTLSAQATDIGVNKATKELFKRVSTPADMVMLGKDTLISHIKTIGLYRNKAKNVMAMAHILVDRHNGEVPDDQEALEALPGVGRKTANVVRNIAFGAPTIAVDTHIFRVGNRTRLAPGKNVLEVEKRLLRRVPPAYRQYAHHWLILHGRYVCKARKPQCGDCRIHHLCLFPEKTAAQAGSVGSR